MRFKAVAEGSQEKYVVAVSEPIKTHEEVQRLYESHHILMEADHTRPKFNALINGLVQDGWEPKLPRGQEWFGHRFRRQARQYALIYALYS